MFRKLVSNLPYSPALVGQLGFYARRLKKEEATRRLGLIFTALALVVQSFAVFSPPEAANAASNSDFIYGGITTPSQLIAAYDASARGNGDLKKIFDYAGVTRAELSGITPHDLNSQSNGKGSSAWLSWGRVHRLSAEQGEVAHNISGTTIYTRPLWRYDTLPYTSTHGSTYPAFIGHSAKMGTFYIMKDCSNLITSKLPPTPTPTPPPPAPPKEESRCVLLQATRIERTKYTLNATSQVLNGAKVSAYTFTVKNDKGVVVATKKVNSTATTAGSGTIELKDAGNYTASVSVTTSAGEKTAASCTTKLCVSPPEKCQYNPDLTKNDKECQPCPDNPNLWYKDDECAPKVASAKNATNLTQGNTQADTVTANPSDRIEYKVSLYNVGKVPAKVDFTEQLDDVLEYATIQDNGGANYNDQTKVLSWGSVTLKPGEKQTRTFVINVLATIPATPRGTGDPSSYDCIMTNTFGNTINIPVNCATPKVVEQIVSELPSTGPGENLLFAGIVGAIVTYFYARSRQIGKEVRLIRKDFNTGTI